MKARLYANKRRSTLFGCCLLVLLFAHGTAQPEALNPATTVSVWVTTPDKGRLLEKQPDLAFSKDTPSGAAITLDPHQTFQQIEGFGAALTDTSAWLIANELSPAQRSDLLSQLFDPVRGAGLSYLRVPLGASDFALKPYTYDDLPSGQTDPDLSRFSIEHDLEYIIPVAREILTINPAVKFMGSPWSAPAWMKDSGSLNGGSLEPEFYGTYADYFVKAVQAYKAAGVPLHAVTLQNEPHHSADYPSMRMEPGEQAAFVKVLGPALKAAGIDTQILVFDHNWDEPDYPTTVMNDDQAAPYIDGSAFHCYLGNVSAQSKTHDAHPDKDLYFTECSGVAWAANFGDNLKWNVQNLVVRATRNWAKTVLLWNLALNEEGGPKTAGGCDGCRGVVTISPSGAVTFNEEYYVLGQAGKVVRPGAYRIGSDAVAGTVEGVAFKNPDGSTALIALNSGRLSQTFSVEENGHSFSYTLPAGAVASFLWADGTEP